MEFFLYICLSQVWELRHVAESEKFSDSGVGGNRGNTGILQYFLQGLRSVVPSAHLSWVVISPLSTS